MPQELDLWASVDPGEPSVAGAQEEPRRERAEVGADRSDEEPVPVPTRGAVRIEFVELSYGCHRRRFEFPSTPEPVVILGPNGSGKTTLLEAVFRSLYGFHRQRPKERRVHGERRPWNAGDYRVEVALLTDTGRLRLSRDFATDEVVVRAEGKETPLFEGTANPGASGHEARAYRRLLERLVGLSDPDAYERTGYVAQGELGATRLGQDLLQLAAGGHADVESAREELLAAYHALTVEPVGPGERRKRKAGEIDRLRERISTLEERRDEAKQAVKRREPLVQIREATRQRLELLSEEIARLEEAFQGLSTLEQLKARRESSLERLRRLEEAERELDEALAGLRLLTSRPRAALPRYPEDFPERAAALTEGLWPRREALLARRSRLREVLERTTGEGPAGEDLGADLRFPRRIRGIGNRTAGIGLAAAGIAGALLLGVTGAPLEGALLGAIAVLAGAGVALWGWKRSTRTGEVRAELADVEFELSEVEGRIDELLRDIPDGGTLTPETLPLRRREFERQREELRHEEEARRSLRVAMDRARAALESRAGDPGEESARAEREPVPVPREETLLDQAHDLLERLQAAIGEERNERLAPVQLELRDASRVPFSLPDGVRSDSGAVHDALVERRREERETREEHDEAVRRLAYEGRPSESPVAIESRLTELRQQLAVLERRAEAFRIAYALLSEAYEQFRQGDQERLLEAVSTHLRGATGGALGPVTADAELADARVRFGTRWLPLESPPLSYGQLHAVLLAVRLGAADFLAGYGVRLPLIVDDPFVHLDDERAGEVWSVLRRLAADRQVLVATQDRLLVEHLGAAARVVL